MTVRFQRPEFDTTTKIFSVEVVLRNDSGLGDGSDLENDAGLEGAPQTMPQGVRLVILDTGHESIIPLDIDGIHPTLDVPFDVFSDFVPAGGLAPGEESAPRRLRFLNENNLRVRLITKVESVADTVPPVIDCPESFGVTTADPAGAAVAYPDIPVTDLPNTAPDLVCVPASGSVFDVGTTPVACKATDEAGNTTPCSFDVTVELQQIVNGGPPPRHRAPATDTGPKRLASLRLILDSNGEADGTLGNAPSPASMMLHIVGGVPGSVVDVALYDAILTETTTGFAGGTVLPGAIRVTTEMEPGTFVAELQLCLDASTLDAAQAAALRVHYFDTESGVWVPAGVRDRGLAASTGVVGDFGVDPETGCAWAVVDHFTDFAVGPAVMVGLTTDVAPVGAGTVVRAPDAGQYVAGTIVTLTATANEGFAFAGWTGDVTSGAGSVDVVMDTAKTVTAAFVTVTTAPPPAPQPPTETVPEPTTEEQCEPLLPFLPCCGPLGLGQLLCMLVGVGAFRGRLRP